MNKRELYESIMRLVSKEVKRVLNEAEDLTPEDKIDLWMSGEREENIKACSPDKLRDYYKICKDKKFVKGMRQIEAVAKSKNVKLEED